MRFFFMLKMIFFMSHVKFFMPYVNIFMFHVISATQCPLPLRPKTH